MKTLKSVPIFSVGKWNNMSFSLDDLNDIANNFEKLKDIHRIPLKLGHNPEQKVTDGQPALGWAQNIRVQGTKLVADFVNVPTVLANAIKNKLYRTVSIELLMGVKRGTETLRHVLDAVAILGADQPAVNNLGDLDQFLASRTVVFDDEGRRVVFSTSAGKYQSNPQKGDESMDEKEVQALIDKAVDKVAAKFTKQVDSQNEQLEALTEENSDLKRKLAESESQRESFAKKQQEEKVKTAREAVKAIFETAVKAKAITPAQRDAQIKLFKVDDDEAVLEIDQDELRKAFGVTENPREGSEGLSDQDSSRGRETSVFDEVDARVRKFQVEHPDADYGKAAIAVFRADPELHREYLETSPPSSFEMEGAA